MKKIAPKKRHIFDAAVTIFARKGYEKATIEEIAEEAQVAKGTVYYYFASKEELMLFLIKTGFEALIEEVSSRTKKARDAEEKLEILIRSQASFFNRYKELCYLILREVWGVEKRREFLHFYLNIYIDYLAGILMEGIEKGSFKRVEVTTAASSIFGMISVTVLRYLLTEHEVPAFVSGELSRLIKNGISKDEW